eukprot:scaffold7179_cov77-Skeletonema_marinoi.AAC.1
MRRKAKRDIRGTQKVSVGVRRRHSGGRRGNYWQTPGLLRATVTNLSFTVMSPSTSSFDSADLQLSKLKLLKSE